MPGSSFAMLALLVRTTLSLFPHHMFRNFGNTTNRCISSQPVVSRSSDSGKCVVSKNVLCGPPNMSYLEKFHNLRTTPIWEKSLDLRRKKENNDVASCYYILHALCSDQKKYKVIFDSNLLIRKDHLIFLAGMLLQVDHLHLINTL